MQNRYNILQSGFISLENKLLVTPQANSSDLEFDAYILNKPYKDNENLYFYNKGVAEVFSEYNDDQIVSTSFAFQEKAILSFMYALGTRTFAEWIELQNENVHLSALHEKFINDTLNFIAGDGRSMSADSWDLIIDKNNSFNKNSAGKFDISKRFTPKDFLIERDGYWPEHTKVPLIPYNLPTMLQIWISRPLGFSDFLVTSNIIFGKKTDSKTV
jgi:hypothetical protein